MAEAFQDSQFGQAFQTAEGDPPAPVVDLVVELVQLVARTGIVTSLRHAAEVELTRSINLGVQTIV